MKMVLLILVIDGVSLGIYSSEIPHLIFSDADKSEINKLAGYLMIALGAGATIGGLILGKIGDRKSTLFTGRLGLVLTVLGSALFALTIELKLYYLAVITAF
jgi:predicted MFS family arabinose efflux permease